MGATKAAAIAAASVLVFTSSVWADPNCTSTTDAGKPFAVCFDVGNRLYLDSGTDGVGMAIELRHAMRFADEPDLTWKLSHRLLRANVGGLTRQWSGSIYRGLYLRHARDGHVVIPLGKPKKVFLPFDVGAEIEVGEMSQRLDSETIEITPVRVAALIDLSRTANFRRRYAFGVLATWDASFEQDERRISQNRVAPFTMALANIRFESKSGLTVLDTEASGGAEWHDTEGWQKTAKARLSIERVVLGFNDRPLSLFVSGEANTRNRELAAQVGARFAVLTRRR